MADLQLCIHVCLAGAGSCCVQQGAEKFYGYGVGSIIFGGLTFDMQNQVSINRVTLASRTYCTGCGACASTCPNNCIQMKEDREGFLQPVIDTRSCVKCHRCERVCPILNKEKKEDGFETKAYAAINKDEDIRKKSSSGGLFYALSKWIIELDGVVFGARFDEKWEVVHDCSESLEGIYPFMGSKYVQSRLGDTYQQAKAFLDCGRWVLFSGTPCQLGGLRAFLGREYERLIQVDLICHGIPSPKVWRAYLNSLRKGGEITDVNFRDKKDGWVGNKVVISVDHTPVVREKHIENVFFRGFLKNIYLRESCYHCPFRVIQRNSDLTLADYWGVEKFCPDLFDNKGTSIVFSHTEKGDSLVSVLSHSVRIVPQSIDHSIQWNPSMNQICERPSKRTVYFRVFRLFSFNGASHLIDKDPFSSRLKRKLRKIVSGVFQR